MGSGEIRGRRPNVLNRGAVAATLAVTLAGGAALAGCGDNGPHNGQPTQEQTSAQPTELSNEAEITSAIEALSGSYEAVQSFPFEVFGGAADDTQRAKIEDFFTNLTNAKAQIAAAEQQITLTDDSNTSPTNFDQKNLAMLRTSVENAASLISNLEGGEYQTRVTNDQGTWLASEEYLAANPNFVTQPTNNVLSGDTPQTLWDYRNKQSIHVSADPNGSGGVDVISIPVGSEIKGVEEYKPFGMVPGEWGQEKGSGVVVDLGGVEVAPGVVAENVSLYHFDNTSVSPETLSASIPTPWFRGSDYDYDNTDSKYFDWSWAKAKPTSDGDLPLYMNVTYGDMPGVYGVEKNIYKITRSAHGNTIVDRSQFSASYYEGVDDYCFGGQAFAGPKSDKDGTQFVVLTFVSGQIGAMGAENGAIPELNLPEIRQAISDFSERLDLQKAVINTDGSIELLTNQ